MFKTFLRGGFFVERRHRVKTLDAVNPNSVITAVLRGYWGMKLLIHDLDETEWNKISQDYAGWRVISDNGSIRPCRLAGSNHPAYDGSLPYCWGEGHKETGVI